ncbi:MAG: hypothetical protein LBV07_02415, partial [Syntrophobacterales bacterium]|nr:hypothetical protein [Syntrophobacterales bacterium]
GDEKAIYDNLKKLISSSPVFAENQIEIYGKSQGVPAGDDDPWVVPPVYGGKHIMAASIEEKDNKDTPWLQQVNLDVHYRSAAGLGKRAVQIHQEEFVNRAWKQVGAVNLLNQELRNRLLSVNVNKALRNKALRPSRRSRGKADTGSDFIARMMRNLGTMKDAPVKDDDGKTVTSLSEILGNSNIPQAFAAASFQNLTDDLAKLVEGLDTSDVMKNIAENQIFRMKEHWICNIPSLRQLREATDKAYEILFEKICEKLKKYFYDGGIIHIGGAGGIGGSTHDLSFSLLKPMEIASYVRSSSFSPEMILSYEHPYHAKVISEEHYEYYGYAKINIIGNSSYRPNNGGVKPNVLVLDSNDYKNMFGSGKVITKVGKNGLYFVSKDRIRQVLDSGAGCFYVPTQYLEYVGGGGSKRAWVASSDCVAGYNDDAGKAVFGNDTHRPAGKYYFELYLNNLPEDFIQHFDTLHEYVEFLKHTPEAANRYLNEWVQLDKCVTEMEEKAGLAAENDGAGEDTSIDDAAADQVQQALDDSKAAWERMREVAGTYYAEFFSNEGLLNKYLDELLLSKYPIMAYPMFPEPTYYYLKMFSDKFILPCVDDLPEDSVSIFESNEAFTEAYLCGMNTEMGRELLWREYPTDQRGSYFRKFWDSETDVSDISSENFFDVQPLHTWKGNLGDNHTQSKTGLLIFAFKGKLMRQYPSTQIFLHKAAGDAARKTIDFDSKATEGNGGIIPPVMQAFLKDDILLIGFKGRFAQFLGNPKTGDLGYFLAFREDVRDLNFEYNKSEENELNAANNAASVAGVLKNDVTLYGKHLSLFIIEK